MWGWPGMDELFAAGSISVVALLLDVSRFRFTVGEVVVVVTGVGVPPLLPGGADAL